MTGVDGAAIAVIRLVRLRGSDAVRVYCVSNHIRTFLDASTRRVIECGNKKATCHGVYVMSISNLVSQQLRNMP